MSLLSSPKSRSRESSEICTYGLNILLYKLGLSAVIMPKREKSEKERKSCCNKCPRHPRRRKTFYYSTMGARAQVKIIGDTLPRATNPIYVPETPPPRVARTGGYPTYACAVKGAAPHRASRGVSKAALRPATPKAAAAPLWYPSPTGCRLIWILTIDGGMYAA